MSAIVKLSFVWVLVCFVLVVSAVMLHQNTVRVMTKETEHWLSLAVKTLDAAHENEQALLAVTVTQDELIEVMSKNLDSYDELCEFSYAQICEIRYKCEVVLTRVDGELYTTVELLLAEVSRLERALSSFIFLYPEVSEEAEL